MPRAIVLAPSEGDKFWIVGDHLTFKITAEQTGGRFAVAQTYIPVDAGPPPHIHGREDELFYVLEGTMMFMDNTHTFTAGPGSAVYLPKGIPHTFKNIGDKPARCILIAAPAGFETFVAECGERISEIPHPKQVGPADVQKLLAGCGKYGLSIVPTHQPIGEKAYPDRSRTLWVLGELVTLKLDSHATNGSFCVAEITSQPGGGVPPHLHQNVDEFFYVLDGEYTFLLDGKPTQASAGTFVFVPAGTFHGFTNTGQSAAKLVDFHTPGKFDQFFEECGIPCTDVNQRPELAPPDTDALLAIFNKHGMEVAR